MFNETHRAPPRYKISDFFSSLLGYRQVNTASKEGIHGGFWPISEKEGHSIVQLFIRVDNVKVHAKKAELLGAHIVIPPQTLPDGDEMTVAVDPDGIPFAMFRSAGSAPR
jgi:predicted enzyme related to lactoylglutathione lyase